MRRTLPPYLLTTLLLLSWLTGWAQNNYPVQVQVLARPPYSTYLADLSSPVNEQLFVTLLLKDLRLTNRQVRLKTVIEGPGTRIVGADNVPAPPVDLLPGSVIQLRGSDLALYFRPENLQLAPAQYARPLPEGMYRFCFTVFDYQTNQQLSPTVCSNYAWLQRSDPPLVVLPSSAQPVPVLPAQQVIFQWIPRHSQVSAVDYEITLTEIIVPQGFTGNPQNLFFSQPPYFVTRTSGNSFLYGPSHPPLTPGRLYGYRVQAVPRPGQEGRTSFVNDGFSPVGFFAYGYGASQGALAVVQGLQKKYAPPAPPDNMVKTMKGQVIWSFKKSELEADTEQSPWVVQSPAQASGDETRRLTEPAETSNVANPLENAQVSILANGQVIGTAKTDKDGRYEIKGFNPDVLEGVTTLTVRATSTEDFTTMTYTVPIRRGQPEYDLGQTTLVAQTFRLASQLVVPANTKEDLTVKILRLKEVINRLSYLAKEGSGVREEVTYNGKSYVSIATLTSAQAARRIFYNTTAGDQFVVQVVAKRKSPVYYPLSRINEKADQLGNKAVQFFKRLFTYKSTVTLAGKVGTGTPAFTPREGVRVTVSIDRSELESPPAGSGSTFTKTVTSDKFGHYTLADLPLLKKNGKIKLEAADNTLSPIPQTETLTFTGSGRIEKVITLRPTVSLIAGVLKDQFGKPVSGGLVRIQATGQVIRTNEAGFFIAKAYGTNPVSLQYAAPGFQQKAATYRGNHQESKWKNILGNTKGIYNILKGLGLSALSTANVSAFTRLILPTEQVSSISSAGVVVIQNVQGTLRFVAKLNNSPVPVRIDLANGQSGNTGATGWEYKGTAGVIAYKVVPLEGEAAFVPVAGEITLTAGTRKTVSLTLEPGITLTGTVTAKGAAGPISQAKIGVQDLPYSTQTDARGTYTLIVPKGREIKVKASARKFNTVSVAMTVNDSRTEDFSLEEFPAGVPDLKTLLGYPIDIEKIEPLNDKTVKVSGNLHLPATGVFEAVSTRSLDFSDVDMEVTDEGDGIPTRDVVFREVELDLKGYKFAPVMLESQAGLVLKRYAASPSVGLIGGERLRLNTDRIESKGFDLKRLPRATLSFIDPSGTKDAFKAAFASQSTYPATQTTAQYQLEFGEGSTPLTGLTPVETEQINQQKDRYTPYQVSFLTFLFDRNQGVLNEQGIRFAGKVHLPNAAKFELTTNDVELDNFIINRNLELTEPTPKISETTPLVAKMGGWRASLTKLIISSDFSNVSFGGRISSTDNVHNDFIIEKLAYIRQSDELQVGGRISMPTDGYKISSILLKRPEGFELAYKPAKKAFEIDGPLSMAYKSSEKNPLQRLFPLEVQRFIYRSNHDMFFVTKPNSSMEFGPVTINLRRFVFYRGFDITFDVMSAYISKNEEANLQTASQTINDVVTTNQNEELYAESGVSWGFGISGTVTADIPFIEAKAEASLMQVSYKGKVETKIDSLLFLIDGPGFTAKLAAKGEFSDNRQGFEGLAELKIPKIIPKIECGFKFYKTGPAKTDIELGLKWVPSVGPPIPMGPVSWTRLGGEVDFNIKDKKYFVALRGELVPTGLNTALNVQKDKIAENSTVISSAKNQKDKAISTVKEKASSAISSANQQVDKLGSSAISSQANKLADKATQKLSASKDEEGGTDEMNLVKFDRVVLSVLFDIDECGGWPVIEGSAGLKLLKIDCGEVKATVDFCRTRLVVGLNADIDPLKGLATLKVNGLLYVKPDMVFVGCNAQASVLKLVKANAVFALGINAKRSAMPEGEETWRNISPEALDQGGQRFNGINLKQSVSIIEKKGGFGFGIGPASFDFNYHYGALAALTFYTRFSQADIMGRAELDIKGGASIRVINFSLSGGASAYLKLQGGYTNTQGWNLSGQTKLNFYLQNANMRCNDVSVRFRDACTTIKYPCGFFKLCRKQLCIPLPSGFNFKVCKDVDASFQLTSR